MPTALNSIIEAIAETHCHNRIRTVNGFVPALNITTSCDITAGNRFRHDTVTIKAADEQVAFLIMHQNKEYFSALQKRKVTINEVGISGCRVLFHLESGYTPYIDYKLEVKRHTYKVAEDILAFMLLGEYPKIDEQEED